MLGCIQPMSSPMMKRMLGFCIGCCAFAGAIVTNAAANDPIKPSKIFLPVMIEAFPSLRFKKHKLQARARPSRALRARGLQPKVSRDFEKLSIGRRGYNAE